jgi:arylsulfatase A-like enzyme
VDLAPTILRLLGEPTTSQMDGRVLSEALVEDRLPAVQTAAGTGEPSLDVEEDRPMDRDDDGLSAEDRELLAERLRSLGYVG